MRPVEIEQQLIELIEQLSPILQRSGVDSSNLQDLADHREWGVALDALIWAIEEHRLSITPEQYDKIGSLGAAMGMSPSSWQRINEQGLVQTEPPANEA